MLELTAGESAGCVGAGCCGAGDWTTPLSRTRLSNRLSCDGVRPRGAFSRCSVLGVRALLRTDGEAEPGVVLGSFCDSATRRGLPNPAADRGRGGVRAVATSAGVVNTWSKHKVRLV